MVRSPDMQVDRWTRRELLQTALVARYAVQGLVATPAITTEAEVVSPLPRLTTGVNMFNGLYTQDVERELDEISAMGGSIVRVMVAHIDHSAGDSASKLASFLDKAGRRNLRVIPSLANYYGDNGFHPAGMQDSYTNTWQGIPVLGDSFFSREMHSDYSALLQQVVGRNRAHPALYAWEPGNEFKDPQNPYALVSFMRRASSAIRALDQRHPIASGVISAECIGLSPEQFYGSMPLIDIVTGHIYNKAELGHAKTDFAWALAHGKTPLVEELGFRSKLSRLELFKQAFTDLAAGGVNTLLLGGFIAKDSPDNRNGDREFGMDAIWHTDYEELRDLLVKVSSKTPPARFANSI